LDPHANLALAATAFLLTHFVTSTPLRGALVRSLGEKPYLGLYSLVALAIFGWLIWAYAVAPRVPHFAWPALRWAPLVAMPVALIFLVCAKGMTRITRHPVMWALMLWSGSHVLARPDVRSTLFFGSLFLLAATGTLLMDARKRKTLGDDWKRFAAVTSNVPFLAILQGRNRIEWVEIGWARPAMALAIFLALLLSHRWLFGSPATPL
jgi:uncharacterized membrane protein